MGLRELGPSHTGALGLTGVHDHQECVGIFVGGFHSGGCWHSRQASSSGKLGWLGSALKLGSGSGVPIRLRQERLKKLNKKVGFRV